MSVKLTYVTCASLLGSSSEAAFEAASPPRSPTQKLLTLPSAFPAPDRRTHQRTEHVTMFLSYEQCQFISYTDLLSGLQTVRTKWRFRQTVSETFGGIDSTPLWNTSKVSAATTTTLNKPLVCKARTWRGFRSDQAVQPPVSAHLPINVAPTAGL